MCAHGSEIRLLVPIATADSHSGSFRWAVKPVDECIAPLVRRLNMVGIYTAGACCGHGKGPGDIILHDGRVLNLPFRISPKPSSAS